MSDPSKSAVVYMRVSQAADAQKNSLALQDTQCLEYARYKNLTLIPELVFRDSLVSGSVPINERPEGKQMLEALRTRKASHLILMKLDRLGRNAVDIQQAWLYLTTKLGVTVHILDLGGESFNSQSAISRLIVGMLSMFAEFEVETIRARIRAGFDAKLAAGELLTRPPYGWDAIGTGVHNPKNKREIKRLIPNEAEQAWLMKILEMKAAGVSVRDIAKYLNENKVPTKRGAETWRFGNLHRMLNNRQIGKLLSELKAYENNTLTDQSVGVPY